MARAVSNWSLARREQNVVAGTPPAPANIRRGENCTKPMKASGEYRQLPLQMSVVVPGRYTDGHSPTDVIGQPGANCVKSWVGVLLLLLLINVKLLATLSPRRCTGI